MDKKRGYIAAKEKISKRGTSIDHVKEHLKQLFFKNNRCLRAKSVDSIRKIKEELSRTAPENDEILQQITDDEMELLLKEIEREMNEKVQDMEVAAYEEDIQNYLDQMVREDITCRRCGISSHKNINDEHKCFKCGFNIFTL